MNKLMLKTVSLFCLFTIFLEQFALADSSLLKRIALGGAEAEQSNAWAKDFLPAIPESIATVDDAFLADGERADGGWRIEDGGKTDGGCILLIQDAHTNPSGQKNLAKLLDILLTAKKDLKYVFTEAGVGDNSLFFIRDYGTPQSRAIAAESFIQKGTLHGHEALYLTSKHDYALWGVEDMDLYKKALEDYRQIAKDRDKFKDYLNRIRSLEGSLRPKLLNPILSQYLQSYEKYQKGELALTDYFKILDTEAKHLDIPLSKDLNLLKTLQSQEKSIDFTQAQKEQEKALQTLSLEDQKELKDLMPGRGEVSSTRPNEPQSSQKGILALLEEKLKGVDTGLYPNLVKYFAYQKLSTSLQAKNILTEIPLLEESILKKLILNPDEQKLVRCLQVVRCLEKLLSLQMTPEEFNKYKTLSRDFNIVHLTGFLNRKIMEQKTLYEKTVFLKDGFDAIVERAEEFYELTLRRDEKFIENMDRGLNVPVTKSSAGGQNRVAVLVTGGYHTPNLKSLLKARGISYIVLTPQVYQETNMKKYESILLSQKIGENLPADLMPPANLMSSGPKAGKMMVLTAYYNFLSTGDPNFLNQLIAMCGPLNPSAGVVAISTTKASVGRHELTLPSNDVTPVTRSAFVGAGLRPAQLNLGSAAARLATSSVLENIRLDADQRYLHEMELAEAMTDPDEASLARRQAFERRCRSYEEVNRIAMRQGEHLLRAVGSDGASAFDGSTLFTVAPAVAAVAISEGPQSRRRFIRNSAAVATGTAVLSVSTPGTALSQPPAVPPANPRWAADELARRTKFIMENKTKRGLFHSYRAPEGYFQQINHPPTDVKAAQERLMVGEKHQLASGDAGSLNIYDGAGAQMVAALTGNTPIADVYTTILKSGRTFGLDNIRANPPKEGEDQSFALERKNFNRKKTIGGLYGAMAKAFPSLFSGKRHNSDIEKLDFINSLMTDKILYQFLLETRKKDILPGDLKNSIDSLIRSSRTDRQTFMRINRMILETICPNECPKRYKPGTGFIFNGVEIPIENAMFFRAIAERYTQTDPLDGKTSLPGFPTADTLHHEDWKPISGENAWVILGMIQTAFEKYQAEGDLTKIKMDSPEMEVALSLVDVFEAMQSPTGGIYHAPWGTHGKDPDDISTENNASAFAAFRELLKILEAHQKKTPNPKMLTTIKTVKKILYGDATSGHKGIEGYFKEYAFDKTSKVFHQGGHYNDGEFKPNPEFAVDVQTWTVAVLGPQWIVENLGEKYASSNRRNPMILNEIWEATKKRAGYFKDSQFRGFGFTSGHDVLSSEWTFGAILMAREIAYYFEGLSNEFKTATDPAGQKWKGAADALSAKFWQESAFMREGIEELRVTLEDGSVAYKYSNRRYYITFGWWANPIPSLAGTTWSVWMDSKTPRNYYNPFVLGGGKTYEKIGKTVVRTEASQARETPPQFAKNRYGEDEEGYLTWYWKASEFGVEPFTKLEQFSTVRVRVNVIKRASNAKPFKVRIRLKNDADFLEVDHDFTVPQNVVEKGGEHVFDIPMAKVISSLGENGKSAQIDAVHVAEGEKLDGDLNPGDNKEKFVGVPSISLVYGDPGKMGPKAPKVKKIQTTDIYGRGAGENWLAWYTNAANNQVSSMDMARYDKIRLVVTPENPAKPHKVRLLIKGLNGGRYIKSFDLSKYKSSKDSDGETVFVIEIAKPEMAGIVREGIKEVHVAEGVQYEGDNNLNPTNTIKSKNPPRLELVEPAAARLAKTDPDSVFDYVTIVDDRLEKILKKIQPNISARAKLMADALLNPEFSESPMPSYTQANYSNRLAVILIRLRRIKNALFASDDVKFNPSVFNPANLGSLLDILRDLKARLIADYLYFERQAQLMSVVTPPATVNLDLEGVSLSSSQVRETRDSLQEARNNLDLLIGSLQALREANGARLAEYKILDRIDAYIATHPLVPAAVRLAQNPAESRSQTAEASLSRILRPSGAQNDEARTRRMPQSPMLRRSAVRETSSKAVERRNMVVFALNAAHRSGRTDGFIAVEQVSGQAVDVIAVREIHSTHTLEVKFLDGRIVRVNNYDKLARRAHKSRDGRTRIALSQSELQLADMQNRFGAQNRAIAEASRGIVRAETAKVIRVCLDGFVETRATEELFIDWLIGAAHQAYRKNALFVLEGDEALVGRILERADVLFPTQQFLFAITQTLPSSHQAALQTNYSTLVAVDPTKDPNFAKGSYVIAAACLVPGTIYNLSALISLAVLQAQLGVEGIEQAGSAGFDSLRRCYECMGLSIQDPAAFSEFIQGVGVTVERLHAWALGAIQIDNILAAFQLGARMALQAA